MLEPHGGKLINRVVSEGKDKTEEAKGLPQIVLTKELAKEVQNIAHGVFSPLEGFLTREDYARREVGDFIEIYVRCPVEVCIQRDARGMYKKALAGEIPNFTGVSDPYEEPLKPGLVIESDKEMLEESVNKVLVKMKELGYVK